MDEVKTHEILTTAATDPEGVTITFKDKTSMFKFRSRCYAFKKRAMEASVKAAFKEGVAPEVTGWEDLSFVSKDKNLTLWIGVATKETFGILSIV